MWESIAEIALHVVRWFVKDSARREQYEHAILKSLARWSKRPPRSKVLRDAYIDILRQMKEAQNGVRKEI